MERRDAKIILHNMRDRLEGKLTAFEIAAINQALDDMEKRDI
jgi:hypothetical protein